MFDDQPVHRAMERIFTPLATPHPAAPAPVTPRRHEPEVPVRRRWFMGKDGIAAAGFAIAVTALGVVMVPILSTPTAPPPAPRAVAAKMPAAPLPVPPPIAAQAPALPQPAPVATPVIPVANPVAPAAATAPHRIAKAARPRTRIIRRHRARPRVARDRGREAPRLYGAALRRALARDVIATRRLNQQALRRLHAR
jgi:hypothetical protein